MIAARAGADAASQMLWAGSVVSGVAGWQATANGHQWLMVALGLACGGLARWSLLIRDRTEITRRIVIGDALVMGVLGIMAKVTADRLNTTNEVTAVVAALFGLSSDRIVRVALSWFLTSARRAAKVEEPALRLPPDTTAEIVADTPAVPVVRARTSPEPAPAGRRELRAAFPPPTNHDAIADDLIDRLGDDI